MIRYIYIIGVVLCLGLLLTLGGCSADHDDGGELPKQPEQPGEPGQPEQQKTRELHLSFGSHQYDITRASGDLPEYFEAYVHENALSPIKEIQTYFTYQDVQQENVTWKYVSNVFNYDNNTWTSRVALKDGQFYLYGFMPKEDIGSSVNIVPYQSAFSNGAVLTFKDLNAVLPHDICVIVGAAGYGKGDKTAVPDMSHRLGQFGYHTDDGDNLFLLVDHLFAGLKFNMRLGEAYSQLRGIKVRSVSLVPDDGDNDVIETVTATVTVNSSGKSVAFSEIKKGKKLKPTLLFEGEKELTTEGVNFFACLCPIINSDFNMNYTLESTYDVYDRKGNLIREGEKAQNAIILQYAMEAGQMQTINMTVLPTFIYMLSDPDLDNPTVVVE